MRNKIALIITITICIILILAFLTPMFTGIKYDDNTRGLVSGIIMAMIAIVSGIVLNKSKWD